MASRRLNDLTPPMRIIVFEFLARCVEARVPLLIITTLRSYDEQVKAVADGVSWTLRSLHLAQPPDGLSHAIDVVPFDVYLLHGPDKLMWDDKDPSFQLIGAIGVSLGLKWGVTINGVHKDLGHFEYVDKTKATIST